MSPLEAIRGLTRAYRPGASRRERPLDSARLSDLRLFVGQESLRQFVQDDRLRLVELEEGCSVDLDADQNQAGIVGEPHAPVLRVELFDLGLLTRQGRDSRDRDPLSRSVLVVREVEMSVVP